MSCGYLPLSTNRQADPEEPTPAEEEEVEIFTTPATQMAAAASNFGFNLYRQLAYHDPKANVFLSPLSIAGALTQLSLGKGSGSPCYTIPYQLHLHSLLHVQAINSEPKELQTAL